MGYDVLSDDIKAGGGSKSKGKGKKKKSFSSKLKNMKGFYIHIVVILLLLLLLGLLIWGDFDFGFDKDGERKVTFVGELKEFSKYYEGNVTVYSSSFVLKTLRGKFDSRSRDIAVEGFNGNITFENDSIVLDGIAQKINFGNNKLDVAGESFHLVSKEKTTFDAEFNDLNLEFKEGKMKLGEDMSYDFNDASVNLENFDCEFGYDGVFSFSGKADSFMLNTRKPNLNITFENE